jgi:hypothetical protein
VADRRRIVVPRQVLGSALDQFAISRSTGASVEFYDVESKAGVRWTMDGAGNSVFEFIDAPSTVVTARAHVEVDAALRRQIIDGTPGPSADVIDFAAARAKRKEPDRG